MSKERKQIFILSGQSNMAGRGGVITETRHHHRHKYWDGVVPPECRPHKDILRLTSHLTWEEARDPLHADIDNKKVCGVGPGMPFANAVRDRVGCTTLGLVPCAVGGTAIKEWARGEVLYENMVTRVKKSVMDGGDLMALLWFQGESDTLTKEDAEGYEGKMVKFVNDVREDLDLPCLPIIQVALASGDEKYIETVRAAQLGMKMPGVVCVDAKGLKLNPDNLHLATEAQVQLGLMLADAYLCHFYSSPEPESIKQVVCENGEGSQNPV